MHRVGDATAFVLLGLAQIENQRVLAIDQLRRLNGADFAHRRQRAADQRPRQHRSRDEHDQDERPVVLQELDGRHRCRRRRAAEAKG
jgi:hypothetical protein